MHNASAGEMVELSAAFLDQTLGDHLWVSRMMVRFTLVTDATVAALQEEGSFSARSSLCFQGLVLVLFHVCLPP